MIVILIWEEEGLKSEVHRGWWGPEVIDEIIKLHPHPARCWERIERQYGPEGYYELWWGKE